MGKSIRVNLKLKKIFTVYVILLPILNIYATTFMPSLCVGEFFGVFLLLLLAANNIRNNNTFFLTNIAYWKFFTYLATVSFFLTMFIQEYDFSETITKVLKISFYTAVAFLFAKQYFDFKLAVKFYILVSSIASVYLLCQFFGYLFFKIRLPVIIPNTQLFYSNITNSDLYNARLQLMYHMYGARYRNSSFFLEPAHYTEYVIYAFIILVFDKKKGPSNVIKILIMVAGILISGSTLGYILVVVIIFLKICYSLKNISIGKLLLIMIVTGVFAFISIKYELFSYALMRINTVNNETATTGTMRLVRGIVVFSKMPIFYKIVGIGAGNYAAFIEKYNITTTYDQTLARTNEYMNCMSLILVYSGLIGFSIYAFSFLKLFLKSKFTPRIMLLILLIMMCSSDIFFRATYILGLVFITYYLEDTNLKYSDKFL